MIKFYFFNYIHFVMQGSIPLIPMCWRCHGSWILVIQRKDTKTSRTAKTKRPAIKPCWRSCGRHCDAPTGTASSSREKGAKWKEDSKYKDERRHIWRFSCFFCHQNDRSPEGAMEEFEACQSSSGRRSFPHLSANHCSTGVRQRDLNGKLIRDVKLLQDYFDIKMINLNAQDLSGSSGFMEHVCD